MSHQTPLPPEPESQAQQTDEGGITRVPLHPAADDLIRWRVYQFAASLVHQAKLIAFMRDDDLVTRNHVNEALERLNRQRESSWLQALLLTIGSAFFGAGVQGFITEVSNNRPSWIVTYGVLALVGMILVSLGIILMARKR